MRLYYTGNEIEVLSQTILARPVAQELPITRHCAQTFLEGFMMRLVLDSKARGQRCQLQRPPRFLHRSQYGIP